MDIPVAPSSIDNYYMSLDGHIIITTKINEFIQGWLTFIDDENLEGLEEKSSNEPIVDVKRNLIKQDCNVKMTQKNIFIKPTPKTEYSEMVKNCILNY